MPFIPEFKNIYTSGSPFIAAVDLVNNMRKLKILLASGSPRRLELLQALDYEVRQIRPEYDERIPEHLSFNKIPEKLSLQKMRQAIPYRNDEDAVITADTVVLLEGELLQKPANEEEAREHLRRLSGSKHEVITGVTIFTQTIESFSTLTQVWIDQITESDIDYYIRTYQPFDKAGAYGIQEWIGWSHIRRIDGSFANVMGLPTREIYQHLRVKVPQKIK